MKRKRTLSGIRAALDYKSLNVFGDVVGNFHGRNIPSVEDFNSYLQSYEACDNLKNLSRQNQNQSQGNSVVNKAPENTSLEKTKRGRKPKKRVDEDEMNQQQQQQQQRPNDINLPNSSGGGGSSGSSSVSSSTAEAFPSSVFVPPPPAVIGSISHFFQRFCDKYPSDTPQYESFVKLARAYEGKGVDEPTFYSSMKEILGCANNDLLDEFVALIRPEDSSEVLTYDEPAVREDFPFNVDPKKLSKPSEEQSQPRQQQAQAAPGPSRPSATLNNSEVSGLVKAAVSEKAKEFLLQAKSSMDPHTYVSFLDIMVELRSLYKANSIEEAIEKLDIAKGILTRVNPLLRVELDRYFPIVNANGAKHNLEHHTFEQSQRQYREWQQAQVARKHMLMEGSMVAATVPSSSSDNDKSGGSSQQNWLSDIAVTAAQSRVDPAQQKLDRMKLSAIEKEQIQNAKRIARENALMKNNGRSNSSGAESEGREDLLDALAANTKLTKKRSQAATSNPKSVTASKPTLKGNPKAGGGGVASSMPVKSNSKDKSQKQTAKNAPKPAKRSAAAVITGSSLGEAYNNNVYLAQQNPPRGQGFVAPNNLANLQQGDNQQNFAEFMQFIQHQQQQQQHLHPMASLGALSSCVDESIGERGADNRSSISSGSDSITGGMGSFGGSMQSSYPFPVGGSVPMSVLPPHPSMIHPYAHTQYSSPSSSSSPPSSFSLASHNSASEQPLPMPLGMGMLPQFSSYGHPIPMTMGGSLMQQQSQQQQYPHQLPPSYGSFGSSPSMLPAHVQNNSASSSQQSQSDATLVLPPPSSVASLSTRPGGALLPPYENDYSPRLSAATPSPTPTGSLLPPYSPAAAAAATSAPSSLSLLPRGQSSTSQLPQPPPQPLRPPYQSASNMYSFPPSKDITSNNDCGSGSGSDGHHSHSANSNNCNNSNDFSPLLPGPPSPLSTSAHPHHSMQQQIE